MNKVSLSLNLVLVFSLVAISMVESRTLDDLAGMTGAGASTEASSSVDAELILVNDEYLSDTVDVMVNEPHEVEATMIKETKAVTFVDTIPIIMNVDDTGTPCMIDNKHLLTDNANKIILGSVKITVTTGGITDSSEGTTTDETESTGPQGIIYDRESVETAKSVPRGIGGDFFFGKAISGSSENYNVSNNDFYNQIYQTMNRDVFVVGKFANLADTPHNRMVLAKFNKEETNSDDASTENVAKESPYFKY
ncbi:hypothetical protein POM88_031436 [Heracleum sosnowskyi]|uniref:Uncharacterized protein n=1 Tax=Heracleum sosnowskyi TaxID=360622 RepID=A0AAD8MKC7_9APIA|nr:hypothetical protein POM88_031436 [Heracleum sosnowskyi]